MKKINILIPIVVIAVLVASGYYFKDRLYSLFFSPTKTEIGSGLQLKNLERPKGENKQKEDETSNDEPNMEVIAQDLNIPWEIAFLPGGDILVTERSGDLLRIKDDAEKKIKIEGVKHIGEGGLLGMALHPNYPKNGYLYLYLTAEIENGLINRVERYRFNEEKNELEDKMVILDNIPGAKYHDGGRIEFGPDGYLYITTGDATNEQLAQNKDSLAGKILRINDDGSVPNDNPFGNAVYSYGHRNPQGLAWDDQGRLWSAEHGPSVTDSGQDEINLIKPGANYGWPESRGEKVIQGTTGPVIQSGRDDTWAPAGAEIIGNKLLFAGLRGEAIYEANIEEESLTELKMNFRQDLGRLRAIRQGPDGRIYITTSNQDGRGSLNEGDDKLIAIKAELFE